jgi:transposase-like protein
MLMFLTILFSLPADLCLDEVSLENEVLTLVLKSSQGSAVCPECSHSSTRIRRGHRDARRAPPDQSWWCRLEAIKPDV